MKGLFASNVEFNDTTFTAGLQECYDPEHHLTKWGDMGHTHALSDYTRRLFGVFGFECGREWAVPHSDFFEGLGGVSGTYYHGLQPSLLGARPMPLFEMVYRDCIAIYGKYGYDYAHASEYVLHHIIMGRPLHYHSWGKGLYWK